MSTCESCGEWQPARSDVYCSWCCARLVAMRASLSQSTYTLDQLMPPAASLLLENSSGHNVIEVDDVEPSDAWIQIDWKAVPRPLILQPGEKAELRCRVLPVQLRKDSYTRGQIIIRSNIGEDKLFVDVTPALDVTISSFDNNTYKTPCEFEIVLSPGVVTS